MAELYGLMQSEHDSAWDLLKALTGAAGDDPPAAPRRKTLARKLVSLLSGHELTEELVVWPSVRHHCPDGPDLAAVGLEQEHDLKLALNELASISPSTEFDECVNTVARQMRLHLSYEKSQVWPRLDDALSGTQETDLVERWRRIRAASATRPHPHLPADPTFLSLTMPLLATADRWSDALRRRVSPPGG